MTINVLNVGLSSMSKYSPWNLKDLKQPTDDAPTVFSCFHCGGGSTMGYKLAGFNVIGGVEIDPKMMDVYRKNFNPKHSYLMGVQDFKKIPNEELPKDLFNLDILDGSPPCSSFSMAGSREKAWGEKKKFREGQAEQVLDELFFDFIDIAKKLQPKVVVAENVSGLIKGNARSYVKRIINSFKDAGYETQLFLLNSAFMGVPQRRERTFFVARRINSKLPHITLNFSEPIISLEAAFSDLPEDSSCLLGASALKRWNETSPGCFHKTKKGNTFGFFSKEHPKKPSTTQTGNPRNYHWKFKRLLNNAETLRVQSFPDDYNFLNLRPHYLCGMSVPPKMMEKVAIEIKKQWLSKYKLKKRRAE